MVGSLSQQVIAPDTYSKFLPVTGWLPSLEVSKVKSAIIVSGATTDFRSRLAWQTAATSVQSPGTWASTDTFITGADEVNSGELTPTLGANMWVRLGVEYKCNSGSNQQAWVSAVVAVRR